MGGNSTRFDAQQVYEVLLRMLDRWNSHDIEGHLEVYRKSPELLVIVDYEQFNGWQQLRDSYLNGVSGSACDGVYPTQTHPGQVAEAGYRPCPHLVVGLLPDFQAHGGGKHHDRSPKV
jgi:hypothetical protein